MKKTDTHAFVNQILVCVLVTICFGGSLGLGTVWMRHQISLTANTNRLILAQIAELQRSIDENNSLIDTQESLELLQQRNTEWHLGLVPVGERQIVHVADSAANLRLRLAARANRELFTDRAVSGSFRVALGQ